VQRRREPAQRQLHRRQLVGDAVLKLTAPASDHKAMAAVAGLFGLLIGSFLNVVAHRLPLGVSLVRPRSRCPQCLTEIKPYDNVPVLGWLMLRGRCRGCRARISARYPVVEAATAALAVAIVAVNGRSVHSALGLVLLGFLVPITLIDLDHRLIPNKLTLPAAVAAIVIGAALHPSGLPEQLIAGAGAALFLLVFLLAYPGGMGMGDVKLAGVLGLFLGRDVGVAILVAVFAGAVIGAAVMARVGVAAGRKTKVPFGPFLALGALVAMLVGPAIVHWYLHAVA
jgi:leader peptidase (prepilin peptidase)/N-methyltransferase